MNFRVSDFCHFVNNSSDFVALYNALTLGVVIVDKETAKIFSDLPNKVISSERIKSLLERDNQNVLSELLKHKIIFPLGERPDLEDYRKIQDGLSCKKIGIIYLLMTDACNLACTYCFIENGMPEGYKFSSMSSEIASFGLNLFAQSLESSHGIEEPQVIFYGGEPLTNFPVMKKAFSYIRKLKESGELPAKTSVTINTNGTLISRRIISVLKNVENLNIAISLDGPKEIHDACRKYHSGGGTFEDIVSKHRMLVDSGINAGFCCTINKHNVDHLEEISKWFVDVMGAKSMGFNILIENSKMEDVRGDFEVYAKKASKQIVKCFRFFRDRGVYEDRIMRKVNAFVDGYIYYHDCGGCGQQIVVSPDGKVGVCQGYCGTKKYFIKPDKDFNPLNHPIWEEWRYRSPLFMDQCRNCIALSICGGGCPYSADTRNGNIWELDDVFCVHAKTTTEFLIKDLMEKIRP